MKYVCKDKFIKVISFGRGRFSVLEFNVGDILEYIVTDEDGSCDFKTDKGHCIKLSFGEAEHFLEEVK